MPKKSANNYEISPVGLEDTENGSLGWCHDNPGATKGWRVTNFPLSLVVGNVLKPGEEGWGPEAHDDWSCFNEEEGLFCEQGEGCRILSYAADIRRGYEFAPATLIWNSEKNEWLIDDGHHRIAAYSVVGLKTFAADIFPTDELVNEGALRAALNASLEAHTIE